VPLAADFCTADGKTCTKADTTCTGGGGAGGAGGAAGSGGASGGSGGAASIAVQCAGVAANPPSNGTCVQVGGAIECNPVTNAGCAANEACDSNGNGYECYPATAPDNKTCGQDCGNGPGLGFCAGKLSCVDVGGANAGKCGRYCCTDADCGASGKCDANLANPGTLCVCVAKLAQHPRMGAG
jgi:hypothetical protein